MRIWAIRTKVTKHSATCFCPTVATTYTGSSLTRARCRLLDLAEELRRRAPLPLLAVHDLTLRGLAYEIKYSNYWNSTANDDGWCTVLPKGGDSANS